MLVLPLLPLPLPCSLASGGRESAGGWSCFWSCCLFGSWLVDGIVVLPVCGQPSVWEDLALCPFPCCCRWVKCPKWRLGCLGIALDSPLVDVSLSGRQRAPGDTQLRCLERTPQNFALLFSSVSQTGVSPLPIPIWAQQREASPPVISVSQVVAAATGTLLGGGLLRGCRQDINSHPLTAP